MQPNGTRKQEATKRGWRFAAAVGAAAWLVLPGCITAPIRPPRDRQPVAMTFEITGYCNCGSCCGWKRSWFGLGPPVIAYGPNRGEPKQVGITASGVRARPGTVAADTSVLPFGTVIQVPGYGYGKIEDRGGAIKGNRLDLWFASHAEARKWGRRTMRIQAWR
jgi:3D (Asp-Asp-Asp) domain-containing protein